MATPESVTKAIKKYEKEKIDRLMIRVPKGKREKIQEFATSRGESVNGLVNRLLDEAMAEKNDE